MPVNDPEVVSFDGAVVATRNEPRILQSFLMGGFECSTHRRPDGRRLDVVAATDHDRRAAEDYRLLAAHGIHTVRDAVRWHLVEPTCGAFDPASFLPMLRAARATGTQVVWDLLHFGWPGHYDIWSSGFVDAFARFARAVATAYRDESDDVPFWTPINEINFFGWAGGDVGYLNPFARGRGPQLKEQLVRAAIAAIHALRDVDRRARIFTAEPLIHVHPANHGVAAVEEARAYTMVAQFDATDFLLGLRRPELGGSRALIDVLGVNYYARNQWIMNGPEIPWRDPRRRPLRYLLADVHRRCGVPMIISETGIEGDERPGWLRYVAGEAASAIAAGVPLAGLCWYPILDHPGWDDDRDCPNGLFCGIGAERRPCHAATAELALQRGSLDIATRHSR